MVSVPYVEKRLGEVFNNERQSKMQNLVFGGQKAFSFQDIIQKKMQEQQAKIVAEAIHDAWDSWTNLEELYSLLSDPNIRPLLANIRRSELEAPEDATSSSGRTRLSKVDIQTCAEDLWSHFEEVLKKAEKPVSIKELLAGLSVKMVESWKNQSIQKQVKLAMDAAGVEKDASKGPAYTLYSLPKAKKHKQP